MEDNLETMGEAQREVLRGVEMSIREEGDAITLEGRMMPYDTWSEVNSSVEGHFLERFSAGSLAKTLQERSARIRVLFEHGMSRLLDMQPIAEVTSLRDEGDGAYYEASLLEGLPDLLVNGLRRGLYGSSIRFKAIKWDRVRSPKPSEYNPTGLPEHTIREARLREFSVVTFPVYEGATAGVRSLTDEFEWASIARQLIGVPPEQRDFVLQAIQEAVRTEPEHSEEPVAQEPEPESRSTRVVTKDYLRPEEGEPPWLL